MNKLNLLGAILQGLFFIFFASAFALNVFERNWGWAFWDVLFMGWTSFWFFWNLERL